MRERNRLAASVDAVKSLERELSDAVEFAQMADAEATRPRSMTLAPNLRL
jgi:peptide chain release factor 2